MEPLPKNIDGEKRVVHRVEHEIQWAYVAGAAAVIVVGLVLFDPLGDDLEDDDQDVLA